MKEALFFPDKTIFIGMYEHLKLGLNTAVIISVDFWAFESMVIMGGLLGVKE